MYPHIRVVPRSLRCGGCFVVSVAAYLLVVAGSDFASAQQAQPAPDQPVALPAISVTAAPPSRPTVRGVRQFGRRQSDHGADPERPGSELGVGDHGRRHRNPAAAHRSGRAAKPPGTQRGPSGGPGSQTSVFIRGTNSNHVKVLIDGIDVSDPSSPPGAFDFGQLLTGDIARIEVLRGPQSGLYGSDAIGGVISITTKSGSGPPKVTATLETGSLGTFNQGLGLSGSEGNFNYVFNIQHFQSTAIPVTPAYMVAPGEQANNNSYNNWTYSTKLGYTLSNTLAFNVVGRYTNSRLLLTNDDFLDFFPTSYAEPLQTTQTDHQFYGRAEMVWSPTVTFKNFFGVNYTNEWSHNVDPNPDSFTAPPLVAPPTTNLGQRTQVDWRGEARVIPGQTFVFGLEDKKESLSTDSTGAFNAAGILCAVYD